MVSARPEELIVSRPDGRSEVQGIKAVIRDSVFLGLNTHYFAELETGKEVEIIQESEIDSIIPPGSDIVLTINTNKINVFDSESTKSLMKGVKNSVVLPEDFKRREVKE